MKTYTLTEKNLVDIKAGLDAPDELETYENDYETGMRIVTPEKRKLAQSIVEDILTDTGFICENCKRGKLRTSLSFLMNSLQCDNCGATYLKSKYNL